MTPTARPEPTSPDVAPEEFGRALGVLLRSYRELITAAVDDVPQGARGYETLAEVVRADQPSQSALANRLGIDRTVMTYLLDDLVTAGLIERRPNPADRRQRRIVASDRGRRAIATLCEQMAEAERAVLGSLDNDERELFRRLLDKAACGNPLVEHPGDACEIAAEALDGDVPPDDDATNRSRRPHRTNEST